MMHLGLALEFARANDTPLDDALRLARTAGYEFVEPYVYSPVHLPLNSHLALATASAYHHLNPVTIDRTTFRARLREHSLRLSALDAHCSLLLPQVGVPHLRAAIDLAADLDCPIVMSDEGPVPTEWMDLDRAFDLLCFSIEPVVRHARSRGVLFAIELHNALTARPDYLVKLLSRFAPTELGVNFDTGNSFLAGNDPAEYVELVASRVVHVHMKDIPASQLPQRGQITGTRVGVAVGEGVVDLGSVIRVLARAGYSGVLSVECDTLDQARASVSVLRRLVERASGPAASAGRGESSSTP